MVDLFGSQGFAEPQPKPMHQVHLIGGQVGGMRTQHLENLVAGRRVNFDVELRLGVAQFFPRRSHLTGLLIAGPFRRMPRTIVDDSRLVAPRKMPSHRSLAATTAKRMGFPRFSASASACVNRYCSMLPKSCSGSSSCSPEAARRSTRTCNTTTSRRSGLNRSSTEARWYKA